MSLDNQEKDGNWERLKFTLGEVKEIVAITAAAYGYDPKNDSPDLWTEEDVPTLMEDVENGYILRKNNRAVAFIEFANSAIHNTVVIRHVAVIPEERSAGMTRKILKIIRTYASERAASRIAWLPASEAMEKLTSRLKVTQLEKGLEVDGISEDYATMAINDLSEEKLMARVRETP
jgi:hypothetical protein